MTKKQLDLCWFNPDETHKEWAERRGLTLATFVTIPCANCGEDVEFRFTGADSEDKTFNRTTAPLGAAKQIDGMSCWCSICGARVTAYFDTYKDKPILDTFVD